MVLFFKPLMNTQAALMRTGPLMNADERSCSAQGCLAVPLKPKTSPAWPPFSTGALAGGRKGGGIEGGTARGAVVLTADEHSCSAHENRTADER